VSRKRRALSPLEELQAWDEMAEEALHAERCPQRRKQSAVNNVLNILDELKRKEARQR
jgi:hypothetical protein